MTTDRPVRIAPLADHELSPAAAELMAPIAAAGRSWNVFRTMAHHPDLMRRWLVFANHVLFKSTLSARDREIAILRVGWNCGAEYEWAQHAEIGRTAGLSDDEVVAVAVGPDAPNWTAAERLVLRATDELHATHTIADATWAALQDHYDDRQLMDLVFAVGQYTLVSMALNTFGVPLDDGLVGFPDLPAGADTDADA
jgi:4-carboxymuconolactone decarboxylase